jgi:F-type H+-transporting ATPase subunit alpha
MKQPQYEPLSLVKEVVIIFAATNGYLDDIPTARVRDFERDLFRFMETQYRELADTIAKDKKFDKDIEAKVRTMIEEFKKTNSYADAPKEPAKADAPKAPAAKAPAKAEAARA